MNTSSLRRAGFSLIEILVVISIIGIIAAFAIPAATKMVRGTDVNRGTQMVADFLSSARQTAIARNKQIEVRFIRFADPEQPGESVADITTWKIRGLQMMEVAPSGIPVQMAPIQRLPGALIFNDGRYSSLFTSTGSQTALRFKTPGDIDPALPRVTGEKARKYSYASFRFKPDGSTDLSVKGNWYLTMHTMSETAQLAKPASGDSDPIKSVNYFTLQIDPVTGSTRSYRPRLS